LAEALEVAETLPSAGLERERPLGISSSMVFLISVLVQGIGFVGNYFISHHIGQYNTGLTAIGVSGAYLTIASTINGLADLRIGSAYTYYIARGRKATELTGTYALLRVLMMAGVGAGLFLIAPNLYFVQGAWACVSSGSTVTTHVGGLVCGPGHSPMLTIPAPTELAVLGLFLIIPLLWTPGTVYSQYWIARGESVRAQLPLFVQSIVQTAGLLVVAFITPPPVEALWGFVAAYALGGAASAILSLPTVVRLSRSVSWSEGRKMFVFAWPLMGGLMLAYVWTVAPTFFVLSASALAVTMFLAANGFRILLLGLPAAVSLPLFPHLTNLHVRREYELLRRRTWTALRYTALVVVPAAMAIVVYRAPLLNILFVHSYAVYAAPALALFALSAIPAAFSQIILTAFTSVGRQRLDLYLQAVQVVVLLGAAALILPPYGPYSTTATTGVLVDAGIAILASSLAGLAVNTYFMERVLAVRIQPRPIGAILLSAAASFLAISTLNRFIDPSRWFILIPAVALGFAVYYLVLSATGELSKQDAVAIFSFVGLPASFGRLAARFAWRKETRDAGEIVEGEPVERSDAHLDATRKSESGDAAGLPGPAPAPPSEDVSRPLK
jgi:O-antigen/teichoic acid export membrane protein